MTIEEAICARVSSLTPVIALAGARVYLAKLPQQPAYPCVRVSLIDDRAGQHLRGPEGTQAARVQVDCYAREGSGVDAYSQAASLAAAVHGDGKGDQATGVFGWIGVVGSPGIEVLNVSHRGRTQGYDPDEVKAYNISHDYIVRYRL